MYCSNCGNERKDEAKFCGSCGIPFQTNDAVQQSAASAPSASVESAPSITTGKLTSPEAAMLWSLLLSPLIGSIFWSKNWIGLGKRQHIWWTWMSAILVVVTSVFSMDWFGNQFVGSILYIGWVSCLYVLQRSMIPKEVKSVVARVVSGFLVVGLLIYAFRYSSPNMGIGLESGASVTVGTSYDKNSEQLAVSGVDYAAGKTLYARAYSPKKFGNTSIKFLIEKQDGSGWVSIVDQDMSVSPDYQIMIANFYVTQAGTYKLSFVNGNETISDKTIKIHE